MPSPTPRRGGRFSIYKTRPNPERDGPLANGRLTPSAFSRDGASPSPIPEGSQMKNRRRTGGILRGRTVLQTVLSLSVLVMCPFVPTLQQAQGQTLIRERTRANRFNFEIDPTTPLQDLLPVP